MEIMWWHCYVLINSALIIPSLVAKPFSLNEYIAEESRQKTATETTTRLKLEESNLLSERSSAKKVFKPGFNKLNRIKAKGLPTKPFSLNDLIAAETRQKNISEATYRPKLTESNAVSGLNHQKKFLKPSFSKLKGIKATGLVPRDKNLSLFHYRKAFQIKSPLKPKKLKYVPKFRLKRKNQSKKREIGGHDKYTQKYIPLLKSLRLLFDNLIHADNGDSFEIKRSKTKRSRKYFEKNNGGNCECALKSNTRDENTTPLEETTTITTAFSEASITTESPQTETPTTTTYFTSTVDIGIVGQNTDVSLLLSRDPGSSRRDDNEFSETNSTTYNTSSERNIPRDNRNGEHYSGNEQNSSAADNEENSNSTSRNDEDSNGDRGIRGNGEHSRNPVFRREIEGSKESMETEESETLRTNPAFRRQIKRSNESMETEDSETITTNPVFRREIKRSNESMETEDSGTYRRVLIENKGKNHLKMGGNKEEGPIFIPEPFRGQRGPVSEDEINSNRQQSTGTGEESNIYVTYDNANDKRFTLRNGAFTPEAKKINREHETLITVSDLSNATVMLQSYPKNKAPIVTIIDGYSVARDKNGKNMLSGKSIRFYA